MFIAKSSGKMNVKNIVTQMAEQLSIMKGLGSLLTYRKGSGNVQRVL